MSRWSSPVPEGSRLTSGFGRRWGTLHAGTDYAPPRPGQTGVQVRAVHAGTIIATGRGRGRAGDRIPYHSGRFVWLDIGAHGGDRMRVYYGHLRSISVKAGQKVQAGQVVGVMGGSGATSETNFAIHLHIGVSQNHNRPINAAGASGAPGWINPAPWLRSKGITPGASAPVTPGSSSSPASSSKSVATSKPAPSGPTPRQAWRHRGYDYINDDSSTKDHQLARVHEYALQLPSSIIRDRSYDYINSEVPSTLRHQVARAHQYSMSLLSEARELNRTVDALADALADTLAAVVNHSVRDAFIQQFADLKAQAEHDATEQDGEGD